ncbi:hypothetical protein ACFSKN_07880 [Mariniflexile gromovii]|uniref:Uncharacterized protein n=1 Tax=Mariniflexile gromovii TaxID=362523 RepID=A0ABS4BQR3_9FLAO|nr:hypothetical protein [Mariniflexile gromovii]MBP0902924.1 hypothetical protein [Mariniflexile gromovii]
MILLEGNMNLDGIFILIFAIMFGPAILLAIIGATLFRKNKKAAKVLFILAVVYIIISLGICGSMMV